MLNIKDAACAYADNAGKRDASRGPMKDKKGKKRKSKGDDSDDSSAGEGESSAGVHPKKKRKGEGKKRRFWNLLEVMEVLEVFSSHCNENGCVPRAPGPGE